MYAIIISSTYKILQNDAESGKELFVMWICPNCQNECETPFCPLCGYQMPTQYSEMDVLTAQIKKQNKRITLLMIFVIVLAVLLIATIVAMYMHVDALQYNIYKLWSEARTLWQDAENQWGQLHRALYYQY